MGFIETARRKRQTEAVARREEELADGHAAVRFAGYVTVSAHTLDELEHDCSEIEHAAQMSRLELLRLYGQQAEAFTYTLPLCRGCGEGAGSPGTAPRPRTSRPRTRSSPKAGSGPRRVPRPGRVRRLLLLRPLGAVRALTSPNAVVIGIVGRGKSSLVKTYVLRQAVFGRQAWIVDVKGEYERLAEALCVQPIALSPGGPIRLNPLTPRGGPERQLNLLYSVAAAALERPPRPRKRAGQEAIVVLARRSGREPTLPDVVDVLVHPPAEMAEALAMDVVDIATSCGRWRSRSTSSAPGTCAACSTDRPPRARSQRAARRAQPPRSSTRRRQRSGS